MNNGITIHGMAFPLPRSFEFPFGGWRLANELGAGGWGVREGPDWVWAVCVINGVLLKGMTTRGYSATARRKTFHHFSIAILLVATIYYDC